MNQFIYTNVRNRKTYFYKLEDIDLNGTATEHGPVNSTPKWIYAIKNKETRISAKQKRCILLPLFLT